MERLQADKGALVCPIPDADGNLARQYERGIYLPQNVHLQPIKIDRF
jgi:hypothetical protein